MQTHQIVGGAIIYRTESGLSKKILRSIVDYVDAGKIGAL